MRQMLTAKDIIADFICGDSDEPRNWSSAANDLIAALEAAGLKVVAREPTLYMVEKASEQADCFGDIWRAMWDATEPERKEP